MPGISADTTTREDRQILKHLHSNHMGIKKTRLLDRDEVCIG